MICSVNATVCNGTSCLVPSSNYNEILSLALSTVLTVLLAMVMFSMGCNVEATKLWGHIKRPWGIFVGFLCQFGIMPLAAFLLSLAFQVQPIQAIAVMIMGCCPGGTGSNIISYWVDGDMDLSVSMTACSTILAMGMMPLCLFIYTKMWTDTDAIQIPYDSIGITLVTLLIPVGLGIYVKHKWPKKAKAILKVGSIAGAVLIAGIAVVGGVLYQSSWVISPSLWIIGVIYPAVGFGFGFLLARLVGQPYYRCRTIAIETGFQNSQLCSTIVQLSFSPEELEVMFSFPLIYSIFQMVFAALIIAGYRIYKKRCSSDEDEDLEKEKTQDVIPSSYAIKNEGFHIEDNVVDGKHTQL